MDIMVLDEAATNRVYLIDDFKSFIWTERYAAAGDFVLTLDPTPNNVANVIAERNLSIVQSNVVMKIETALLAPSSDGAVELKVVGRSFERVFEDKVVYPNWVTSTDDNQYIDEGDASSVLMKLVRYICEDGNGGSASDIIPELATSNTAGSVGATSVALTPGPLYDAMVSLATQFNFGFRVDYRPGVAKSLHLILYRGVERPNVIFSSMLDNLSDESYLKSVQNFKNVAYVASTDLSRIVKVYSSGASESTTGLNRRVLWVDTDIDASKYTEPKLTNVLTARGREALNKHKKTSLMDGVITDYSMFRYKVDYDLGDTIYIMDEFKTKTAKVVSEYIRVWDREGARAYPTFASTD